MLEKLIENPNAVGGVMLLLLAVYAFVYEKIIPGPTHRSVVAARDLILAHKDAEIVRLQTKYDEMQAIAFRLAEITERTQNVAVTAAGLKKAGQ